MLAESLSRLDPSLRERLAERLGKTPAELESEAAARFDRERMSQLEIYPGWRASDKDWVLDGVSR
jgi:hypothetical protein